MNVTLVRKDTGPVPAAVRACVAQLLEHVDGLGGPNAGKFGRFLYGLLDLEAGEICELSTRKPRVAWFHRKHMALESALFDAQEVFEHFDQFRDWLKIGAGLCDYFPGINGMVAVPRSIAWDKMEEDDFRVFERDMLHFLRGRGCGVLWPGMRPAAQIRALEDILVAFNR